MTPELSMLAATAVLAALLTLPYGLAMWTLWPVRAILGNRDEPPPPLPAWAERARRAQQNMLENFPPFAALVLVVHAAGLANQDTALGASIFFGARLAHALVYVAGVWQLRALAFFAGVGGQSLIVFRILGWSPRLGAVVLSATVGVIVSAIFGLRRCARRGGFGLAQG